MTAGASIALAALGAAVPASAAQHPASRELHSPGGNESKTAHLNEPVRPAKIGNIAFDFPHETRVSATRFAVRAASASCGAPQLCYHGGPVQQHPQVYLVFWGTWWHCSGSGCVNCPGGSCGDPDSLQVENYLYDYWHQVGLPGESTSTVTAQYYARSGRHPTLGHSVWGTNCSTDGNNNCGWVVWQQDPPPSPTADQIAGMAKTAADYFGLQNNPDAQIIVLTPQGNQPDGFPNAGFCAWHSDVLSSTGAEVSLTLMPWLPDTAGLGGLYTPCFADFTALGADLDGWSVVGGHEFAESVTDPVVGTGYATPLPGDPKNTEIGDRCASRTFTETMQDGSKYKQQELWSNLDHGCVKQMPAGAIKGYRGKCVDNAGGRAANGNKIEIWRCNGTPAQLWFYTPSSGHLIVNGGCLDVTGASRTPGTKVIWYKCGNGANQKWEYDSSSQQWEVYRGILGFGAKCLDDPAFATSNGTQLIISDCNSGANQKWTLPRE